jgi:hypothetical protein
MSDAENTFTPEDILQAAKSFREKNCRRGRLRPRQHNPEHVEVRCTHLLSFG